VFEVHRLRVKRTVELDTWHIPHRNKAWPAVSGWAHATSLLPEVNVLHGLGYAISGRFAAAAALMATNQHWF
jgi:hypothetical protein